MAAPTRVQTSGWQSNDASAGAQTSWSVPITVGAAGRLLILSCAHLTANRTIDTPTDSKSNPWQSVTFQQGNDSKYHQVFVCLAAASGATTITASITGGVSGVVFLIVTEVQGHDPSDWEAFGRLAETSATTTHTSNATPVALGTDPYVYVSSQINAFTNTFTPGTDYSLVDDQDIFGDGSWFLFAQDQSATGAYSSDGPWSTDIAREGTSIIVSFVAPAAAGLTWLPSTRVEQGPRVTWEPAGMDPP